MIRVSDTFISIQGESTWAGYGCFFIRLAGCNLECSYCDTPGFELEAGATVHAAGSITVRQGIVGKGTRVDAGGSLAAKFVQDAHVEAEGDVLIGSYAHGAFIRSGSSVAVEGRGGSGGGIVGGEVWAARNVCSRNIGSERSTTTFVAAGTQPVLHQEYEQAARVARHADSLLKNLLKAI